MRHVFVVLMLVVGALLTSFGSVSAAPTPAIKENAVHNQSADEAEIRALVEQSVDALALGNASAASVGETYTDASFVFLQYCRPKARCSYQQINDYSFINYYYGVVINQVVYTAPFDRRGRQTTVTFRFPQWMYCSYYDKKFAYHSGWGDQLRVKNAIFVYCGWYSWL